MYKYETHLHTSPVSRCARADIEASLAFYKELGYDGVFVTNHFIGGNMNVTSDDTYEQRVNMYFDDIEKSKQVGKSMGIKVFAGAEIGYRGTDFLIYGVGREFFLQNPDFADIRTTDMLERIREAGGLIIQAHPFREANYINHIRLFPRHVDGVEVCNASRPDKENEMNLLYAEHYGLLESAGSDNHTASNVRMLGGMQSKTPIADEEEYISLFRAGELTIFCEKNPMRAD